MRSVEGALSLSLQAITQVIWGNRLRVKPIEWQFVVKMTDGLSQWGRHPTHAVQGGSELARMLANQPVSQCLLPVLGQGAGARRCYHFLCTPLCPSHGSGGRCLHGLFSLFPGIPSVQQELREELTVGEVKDIVQSHTAREQGPGLVLVCLTVARLPTLYHPVPKEAALPSAHESSSLAWVWGLNTPPHWLSSVQLLLGQWPGENWGGWFQLKVLVLLLICGSSSQLSLGKSS